MASAFIVPYSTRTGRRYRVRYRIGGADTVTKHAGSFRTMREARARRDFVAGELAAMRIPDLRLVVESPEAETLRDVAERWRASRVDVADSTATTHRVNLGRILAALGDLSVAAVTAAVIAQFVAGLDLKRETRRKTLSTLAMVLDFAGITPNPARDRRVVKLPQEDSLEVDPPTATHVLAARAGLPLGQRLPLLVLDATGMRVGELEALTWGDVDELDQRWRVRASTAKTRKARWVPVQPDVFKAVIELVPREDRDLSAQVFAGFGTDSFRTALGRACKTAGVPVFSPHQLRHRRATLWHLAGVPVAEASVWLGHSPQEHLKTYAHATLTDRDELSYAELLERSQTLRRARVLSHR